MELGCGMEDLERQDGLEALAREDTAESRALESKLMEVPGMGEVLVGGDPMGVADKLNDCQGNNILNARGDCGLVSVANMLTQAGMEVTEDEIVVMAVRNRLCEYSTENDAGENGGTNVLHRQALLNACGLKATIYSDYFGNRMSLEDIADCVEAGHGVNIDVNAGYAWNDASYINDGASNHSIIVTGTLRDPDTGRLKGLMVCDSGLTNMNSRALPMSVETLERAYVNVPGASAIVTDRPICA